MKYSGGQIKNKNNKLRKLSAKLTIFLALFLMPFLAFAPVATASDQTDLNRINEQLQQTNQQLNATTAQRKTLQGEVAVFDRQIGDIQAQINSTDAQIRKLGSDINITETDIKNAEAELVKSRQNLGEYLSVIYEEGQTTTLELIASSKNFSEFVDRSEYLQTIQGKIKEMADAVVEQKKLLESKKKELEQRKTQTETLRNQQAGQRQEIATQRSSRNQLLQATKGNEAEYQALVSKLTKEYNRVQGEIWSRNNPGGGYVSLGHVNTGDTIGYMGNTGYSTGCHLHFEIRSGDYTALNPANYINNGYFIHPVPGVRVTAPFGYSAAYFGGVFHTGIDYADGCAGTPIKATSEGDIIQRVSGRGNTFPWSYEYGNYVKIRHSNGMYSLYGHLR